MTDVQTFFKEARQKRSKRRKAVQYAQARAEVIERSQSRCEAGVTASCEVRGTQAHHKRRRSQGGADTADNLVWICRPCHDWTHSHPKLAESCGLLERSSFTAAPGLINVERVK